MQDSVAHTVQVMHDCALGGGRGEEREKVVDEAFCMLTMALEVDVVWMAC